MAKISNPFGKKDLIEETFNFEAITRLESKLKKHKALSGEQHASLLQDQIDSMKLRLERPVDTPTWGPSLEWLRKVFNKKDKNKEVHKGGVSTNSQDVISENLDTSEHYYKYWFLYLAVVILGVLVTAGALYVDYQIMHEFWSRIVANEFMEVPDSLANSVVSKSAQVIFATAAFHFVLTRWKASRTIFIGVFFALTVIMISGFGFMISNITMPDNPELMNPASSSVEEPGLSDALVAMGLATPEEAPATDLSTYTDSTFGQPSAWALSLMKGIQDANPFLWMFVPGLVFLVVTGIGALSLQLAEENVQNLIRSFDYVSRKQRVDEYHQLRKFKYYLENGEVQGFTSHEDDDTQYPRAV